MSRAIRRISEALRVSIRESDWESSNYQILTTAEWIEILLSWIDRASLIRMRKVSSFLFWVICKWRYHNAKTKYGNFHLRNIHISLSSSSSTHIYTTQKEKTYSFSLDRRLRWRRSKILMTYDIIMTYVI